MSFIEIKTIKGHDYAYLRDSYREPGTQKVKHHHLGYLGRVSGLTDRSISVDRSTPITPMIKDVIGTKVKETTIPKTDKQKRIGFKLDIPILPKHISIIDDVGGIGKRKLTEEDIKRIEEEKLKKKKKVKRKLIIPTEEELKDKNMFPI